MVRMYILPSYVQYLHEKILLPYITLLSILRVWATKLRRKGIAILILVDALLWRTMMIVKGILYWFSLLEPLSFSHGLGPDLGLSYTIEQVFGKFYFQCSKPLTRKKKEKTKKSEPGECGECTFKILRNGLNLSQHKN